MGVSERNWKIRGVSESFFVSGGISVNRWKMKGFLKFLISLLFFQLQVEDVTRFQILRE
jgi:hypothetical protein